MKTQAAREAEAKALAQALREHARDAMLLAETASKDPAHFRTHPYRDFRTKLMDFQSISSLLRRRLQDMAADWSANAAAIDKAQRAQAEFDRLDLIMLSLFVRTSRRYFTYLSINPAVPLGAVEWLRKDLPGLLETLEELRGPALAQRADPTLDAELTTAILILNDLIGRLPELPTFDRKRPDRR